MLDIHTQYLLFIYSLFVGVYLGVTYDLLELLILKRLHKILKSILQIIFFIFQAQLVFRVFYQINYGIIPLYCYFLFILGYFLDHSFANDYRKQLLMIEKLYLYLVSKIAQLLRVLVIEPFIYCWWLITKIKQYGLKIGKKIISPRYKRFSHWLCRKLRRKKQRKPKQTQQIQLN